MPHLTAAVTATSYFKADTCNSLTFFFTDIQKKQPDDDCAPKTSSNSNSSQADIYCNETNSSISQSLISIPNTSEDPSPGEMGASSLPAQDGKRAVNHSEILVR